MILTRFAAAVVAVSALAGCHSTPEHYVDTTTREPETPADSASMAELINRGLKTTELGVGQLKDPAKTVGFAGGSTETGEKFLDGTLIVDHVARQDADNHFGVTVTVFNNRDDAPALFQWRLAFYNAQGAEIAALDPEWQGKAIDAKRWGTVSNSAAIRGAVKFKLETRAPVAEPPPPPPNP
jgi:hypothetical protein